MLTRENLAALVVRGSIALVVIGVEEAELLWAGAVVIGAGTTSSVTTARGYTTLAEAGMIHTPLIKSVKHT